MRYRRSSLALTLLARMMVDTPEAVRVEAVPLGARRPCGFDIHAAVSDIGKLIGASGRDALPARPRARNGD